MMYVEGSKFAFSGTTPVEIDAARLAFAANVKDLMPSEAVAQAQSETSDRWKPLVSALFFSGVDKLQLIPKAGVNPENAMKHIRACLTTWSTKHEDKEVGVCTLFDLFFEKAKYEKGGAEYQIKAVE